MFKEQQETPPVKDDWIENIISDMEELNLTAYKVEDLGRMTKLKLKTLIKQKCAQKAFEYFCQEKNKNKKMTNLNYSSLKLQEYLETKLINNKNEKLLFRLRNSIS